MTAQITQGGITKTIESADIKSLQTNILMYMKSLDTDSSIIISGTFNKEGLKLMQSFITVFSITDYKVEGAFTQSTNGKNRLRTVQKCLAMGMLEDEDEIMNDYFKLLDKFEEAESNMKQFISNNRLFKASGKQNVPLAVGKNIGNALDGFPKNATESEKQAAFQKLIKSREEWIHPEEPTEDNN